MEILHNDAPYSRTVYNLIFVLQWKRDKLLQKLGFGEVIVIPFNPEQLTQYVLPLSSFVYASVSAYS